VNGRNGIDLEGWNMVGKFRALGPRYHLRAQQNSIELRTMRLLVPEDGGVDVTFVDDAPAGLWLHSFHNEGRPVRWLGTGRCLGQDQNCPYCATGNKPRLRCVFTVVEHSTVPPDECGRVCYLECSVIAAKALRCILLRAGKQHLAGQTVYVFKVGGGPRVFTQFALIERDEKLHRMPNHVVSIDFLSLYPAEEQRMEFGSAVEPN
jgi:hypothetical protein